MNQKDRGNAKGAILSSPDGKQWGQYEDLSCWDIHQRIEEHDQIIRERQFYKDREWDLVATLSLVGRLLTDSVNYDERDPETLRAIAQIEKAIHGIVGRSPK